MTETKQFVSVYKYKSSFEVPCGKFAVSFKSSEGEKITFCAGVVYGLFKVSNYIVQQYIVQ